MPTVSQVTDTPVSGYNHIDALLGALPWNYVGRTSIYFSFDLDRAGDPGGNVLVPGTESAFNASQQAQVKAILAYISQVTGIGFVEVPQASWADLHFANADLKDGYTSQDAVHVGYTTAGDQVANLQVDYWVYLDSFDDAYDNLNPLPGGSGYEALLHEMGHVLGLKHPSEGAVQLPPGDGLGQDNSEVTVMSTNSIGGPYTAFNAYDLAALDWLYGGDGLGGTYGVGAPVSSLTGTYAADTLRGTAGADRLRGEGGNDSIDGGAGIDTAAYDGARSNYVVTHTATGFKVQALSGDEGTDTLVNVERLVFGDGSHVALDVQGNAGMSYRLYQAAFNRVPDVAGLGFHINDLDHGVHISTVAAHFIESPEFLATYGNLDNQQFVQQLYRNVLHREGETAGVVFHTDDLNNGLHRHDLLVQFSESPENQANVIGTIQDGMAYTTA